MGVMKRIQGWRDSRWPFRHGSRRHDKECSFEDLIMCLPIAIVLMTNPKTTPRRVGVPAGADPAAASKVAAPNKSTETDRGLKARPGGKS